MNRFTIERKSADGLAVQRWGFEARFPDQGSDNTIRVDLVRYEAGTLSTPRHKKITVAARLLFGSYYPEFNAPRTNAWFDAKTNDYMWQHADCRSCRPTDERPPFPADVAAEAAAMFPVIVGVAS